MIDADRVCYYVMEIQQNTERKYWLKKKSFKVEVKQPVKFALFSKMISTLIKKYITNTINETILKKKDVFL